LEAKEILLTLKKDNIALKLKGDKLVASSKKGAMTPEFRTLIKDNRDELLRYLKKYTIYDIINRIPRLKERDNIKLSYAQERLWFLDRFEGGKSTTYHIPAVLKLEGSLDKKALNQALKTIIERHKVLRTNFIEKDNITLQKIGDIDRFTIEEIECKESDIKTKIKETLSQPFNLESDMLFRAVLFTINRDRHYLLVNNDIENEIEDEIEEVF